MSDPSNTEPSFEQAMERLEEIVSAMEGDRMPLDEMVTSYEEGMRLLKVCRQRIEAARRRVELITAGADGKTTLVAFEAAATETTSMPMAEAAEETSKPAATRRRPAPSPKPEADEDEEIRLF